MSELKFNGLGAMLEWKYGPIADTREIDGEMVITAWRHKTIAQPDKDQIALDFKEFEDYKKSILYKEKRKEEYPSIAEQLDAIWKIIGSIPFADGVPEEAITVFDQIRAIKEKYPKTETDSKK